MGLRGAGWRHLLRAILSWDIMCLSNARASQPNATSVSLSSSRQGVGSRLDGLRSRGPGCTWDSLRSSMGEKILSLRSCSLGSLGALGPACCGVLSELSEEQAFHVSYLDIGMAGWGAGDGGVWTRASTHGYKEWGEGMMAAWIPPPTPDPRCFLTTQHCLLLSLVSRGAEPEWALPVPGGAVHTADHCVSRLCSHQGGSAWRGGSPRPTVPQAHGGQQVKLRRTLGHAPALPALGPGIGPALAPSGGAISTSDTDCPLQAEEGMGPGAGDHSASVAQDPSCYW